MLTIDSFHDCFLYSYHCLESRHVQDLMYPPKKNNMQPEKLPCQPENRLPFFRVYVKLWGWVAVTIHACIHVALRSGSLAGRSWKRTRVGICLLLGGLGSIFSGFRLHVNKKPCSLRIFGDVMGFQKIQNPSVLRPFSGCHERRVW